jgi:hypothetical protein
LFDSSTINYSRFDVLSSLYDNNATNNASKDYYTDRQDSYSSLLVSQLNSSSNLESNSVKKFLDYNYKLQQTNSTNSVAPNNHSNSINEIYYKDLSESSRLNSALTTFLLNSDINQKFLDLSKNSLNINSTSDGKYYNNPFKVALNLLNSRRLALNLPLGNSFDLNSNFSVTETDNKFSNIELSSKFKELKSSNMGFLSPDKNTRLINKLHTNKGQLNFSHESNNLDDILNKVHSSVTDENEIYNSSNLS